MTAPSRAPLGRAQPSDEAPGEAREPALRRRRAPDQRARARGQPEDEATFGQLLQTTQHGPATARPRKSTEPGQTSSPRTEPSPRRAPPRERDVSSSATRPSPSEPASISPPPSFAVPQPAEPSQPPRVEAPRPLAPAPLDPAHELLRLALIDPSLQLEAHQGVVRLALATEAAGALSLEVRVRDHRADVTVGGPAAPLVAQHAPALREVLAGQGLSLGDMTQRDRSPGGEAPEAEGEPAPAPRHAPRVSRLTPAPRHGGRIDVEV